MTHQGNNKTTEAREELYKLIGRRFFVGATVINSMTGSEVVTRNRIDNVCLEKPFTVLVPFMNCRSRAFYDRYNTAYLTLPSKLRLPYTRMAFPSGAEPLRVDESPVAVSDSHVTLNFAKQAMNAFSGLMTLQRSNKIKLGVKKLLLAPMLKSIIPKISAGDQSLNFLSYNLSDWPEQVQALAYAACLAKRSEKFTDNTLSVVDVIKECVNALPDMLQHYGDIMSLTLPHLIPLENAIMKYCLVREAAGIINGLLRQSGGRGHIDVGQIKAKLACDPEGDTCLPVLFRNVVLHDSTNWTDYFAVYNGKLDMSITPDLLYEHVGEPFVEGYLLMLAVLGCVEVVIEKPVSNVGPAFIRGLKSVKLTKLGCYAFGLAEIDEVEADKQFTVENEFELNDSRLIVTMVVEQSPCALWLSKFGKSIGPRRWLVDEASALTDCETAADLQRQIDFFKAHICPKPPKIWLDFFDTLTANANAIVPDNTDYIIFKVEPGNKALQKLITDNEEIKRNTLMAEDYHLLVPRTFHAQFLSIIRANGYLPNP